MLSDITLGQYFPADSCIHKMDARIKILLSVAFMVVIFCINTAYGYAALFVFTMFMISMSLPLLLQVI